MLNKKITFILSVALIGCILFYIVNYNNVNEKKELGVQAVKLLYEFHDLYQLDSNMEELKNITSDSVYTELTIDNEERLLNTYLKLKGKPCLVNIIKSTDNYVLYSLDTETVSSKRVFIFMFEVNKHKISGVREAECIDFVDC